MKMMIKVVVAGSALSTLALLSGCVSDKVAGHWPMFTGNLPKTEQFKSQTAQLAVLDNTPAVKIYTAEYKTTNPNKDNELLMTTKYRLTPQSNGLTKTVKKEQQPEQAWYKSFNGYTVINSRELSYGGVFNIAGISVQQQQGSFLHDDQYYHKYQIQDISNLKGKLFPLKVGNQLSFEFNSLDKVTFGGSDKSDEVTPTKINFKVVKRLNGYKDLPKPVTGPVYVIQEKVASGNKQPMELVDEVYYSSKLGWYIVENDYKNGKLDQVMKINKWTYQSKTKSSGGTRSANGKYRVAK